MKHALHPDSRGGRRHLPGVVRLNAADGDQRVAPLADRVSDQVLELPHLVATEGKPAVAVVALRPDPRAPEMRGQPLERVHGGRAEHQGIAGKRVELHQVPPSPARRSAGVPAAEPLADPTI
jgi:hypothetical protein